MGDISQNVAAKKGNSGAKAGVLSSRDRNESGETGKLVHATGSILSPQCGTTMLACSICPNERNIAATNALQVL